MTCFGETFGKFRLDGVHDETSADGGAGGDRRLKALDLHHGISDRGAGIEHEIGEILQLLSVAMPARAGVAVFQADERDDLYAALLELLGDLDRDHVAAAG